MAQKSRRLGRPLQWVTLTGLILEPAKPGLTLKGWVGLAQRRPWLSFGIGVCTPWFPKSGSQVCRTHVAMAAHAALSLLPALTGGVIPSSCSPSPLWFAILATVLLCLWDCTASQVSAGIQMNTIPSGSLESCSFHPCCSGWSGVQQLPKDTCVNPAEDWRLWYEAESGSGCWWRGLAEQPPRAMVRGSCTISRLAGRLQPPAAALTSYWLIPWLQISLVPNRASACHLQISDNKI